MSRRPGICSVSGVGTSRPPARGENLEGSVCLPAGISKRLLELGMFEFREAVVEASEPLVVDGAVRA